MENRHVNAIVVGSGAGGGVVAKELAVAGLSVVLFERGRWIPYEEHGDDELMSQRTTVLGNGYGPDDLRYRRVVVEPNGATRIVVPSDGAYNNVAACVGSGTAVYGAMAWRFMPQDFKMRSTYGPSGGLDGRGLANQLRRPRTLLREGGMGGWRVGRRQPEPIRAAAQEAATDAPHAVQYGGRSTGSGRETVGLASFSDTDAPQFSPLQRSEGVRAQEQLRRFRLPDRCQERHAKHSDSRRPGHRPLRVADGIGRQRDQRRRPRPCQGREILRRRRAVARPDGRRGRRFRFGHRDRPLAAELPLEIVSPRGRQQ